jgi:hypothetical protein
MMPLKNFGAAEMTYYDYEFKRLGNEVADLQIRSESGQTRWMTISPEQIKAILEILNKNEVTA